ncbi:DUF6471 domain-containing protein [Uliginosibacterium sp. H3]|uniref:DUF6471 domain-containing protein n=1 Tax=Uliginosibacterium silvisoli TaxID=3114758 RepID=A0ABU6K7B1_9RHOO|nr:DUF6471 domain-containing protein [Uliginosibacterium sp. H3]
MSKVQRGRFIRPEAAAARGANPWGAFASELIKERLARQGWGYRDLADKLSALGLELEPAAVNRKVNRGDFSAGFLLMCLHALGVGRIEFEGERSAMAVGVGDEPQSYAPNATSAGNDGKELDALIGFGGRKKKAK